MQKNVMQNTVLDVTQNTNKSRKFYAKIQVPQITFVTHYTINQCLILITFHFSVRLVEKRIEQVEQTSKVRQSHNRKSIPILASLSQRV